MFYSKKQVMKTKIYNKLNKKERLDLINKAGGKRLTLSFYKYHNIKNPNIFRNHLFVEWNKLNALGRIYVAHEGINAQLSVPSNKMIEFKNSIDNVTFLNGARLNIAIEHDNEAFLKLKVKVRDKIVADGLNSNEYNLDKNGVHVNAEKFNELLDDNKTITIDMRNHYESEIGHFKGALTPDVDTFRESLPHIDQILAEQKKDKKLLMYCTGGIRCEIASSFMLSQGFQDVSQLDGGILRYLENVEGEENLWEGECFVFDERVTVDKNLKQGEYLQCFGCRRPLSKEDLKSDLYEKGVSCHKCFDQSSEKDKERFAQRQLQIELADKRGHAHMGMNAKQTKGSDV